MEQSFWLYGYIRLYLLAFIPIFVAMEPVGLIPVFHSMTRLMDEAERRRVLFLSILTAAAITTAFLALGKVIFLALGITIADFQIAGGLILLAIAMRDIVQTARYRIETKPASGVGVVPIGTPLIAGPAAITTVLMLSDLYGVIITAVALVTDLFIVWLFLLWSGSIVRYIGEDGARGLSKVIALLLAAIAVMMIRKGVAGLFV